MLARIASDAGRRHRLTWLALAVYRAKNQEVDNES